MSATRRTNGDVTEDAQTSKSTFETTAPIMTTIQPFTQSPYIPTRAEIFFLSIFPVTLILGSAFSHLSPTLYPPFNNSTYSVDAQSFQPASDAPSYFARKRNIFNVYFVKIGWFWCTLALLIFTVLTSRGRSSNRFPRTPGTPQENKDADALRPEGEAKLRRRWHTLVRWSIATGFWILVTQWCFGPPLIDRGFTLTGGACELAKQNLEAPIEELPGGLKTEAASLLTHAACKLAGGSWRGGTDISGHVFILVLGSGMLWLEMLPFLLRDWKGFGAARIVRDYQGRTSRVGARSSGSAADPATQAQAPAAVRSVHDAAKREIEQQTQNVTGASKLPASTTRTIRAYATIMALLIAAFSWWMLLMTAAFFHTWFEKLTGWLLASIVLWVVYFLPRGMPYVREVYGMPGV